MINTKFKSESEIPDGPKVVAFTRNYKKIKFQGQFDLKVMVKVTCFQTHIGYLDDQ